MTSQTPDFSPKGFLVEYPLLADRCVRRFIGDFQDSFAKRNSRFVLRTRLSGKALKALFERYLDEEIANAQRGSKFLHDGFSKSVWTIVADSGADRREGFEMLEKDIDVGIAAVERCLSGIFGKRMKEPRERTVYCRHRLLLSSDWEEVCRKKVFGRRALETASLGAASCIVEKAKEMDWIPSRDETKMVGRECADFLKASMGCVEQ